VDNKKDFLMTIKNALKRNIVKKYLNQEKIVHQLIV